jgi:hypothetical protein
VEILGGEGEHGDHGRPAACSLRHDHILAAGVRVFRHLPVVDQGERQQDHHRAAHQEQRERDGGVVTVTEGMSELPVDVRRQRLTRSRPSTASSFVRRVDAARGVRAVVSEGRRASRAQPSLLERVRRYE